MKLPYKKKLNLNRLNRIQISFKEISNVSENVIPNKPVIADTSPSAHVIKIPWFQYLGDFRRVLCFTLKEKITQYDEDVVPFKSRVL